MSRSITYLTFDSALTGVGASQVSPYVRELGQRGLDVRLHTFEPTAPTDSQRSGVEQDGVTWTAHRFGLSGERGGIERAIRAAAALRGADLVHARSDLAALSAMIARRPFVWDVRSFWVDQRIATGGVAPGSAVDKAMRRIESAAAARSRQIITLTHAALPVLDARHPGTPSARATVISTCVDLDRFIPSQMPPGPLSVLLSGTFNPIYDIDTTVRFLEVLRAQHGARVTHAGGGDAGDSRLSKVVDHAANLPFFAMPAEIARHHVGIALCRTDIQAAVVAAMPTKIAEFLASGRPVIVSKGLGDMDRWIEQHQVGVVIDVVSAGGLDAAAQQITTLLDDPGLAARCRHLAETEFSLDLAIDKLLDVYERASS